MIEKTTGEYACSYCGNVFNQKIGKFEGQGSGNHGAASSQVKCPNCGNYLPTWS